MACKPEGGGGDVGQQNGFHESLKRRRLEDQEVERFAPDSEDYSTSRRRATGMTENHPASEKHPDLTQKNTLIEARGVGSDSYSASGEIDWRSQVCSLLGIDPAQPDYKIMSGTTDLASLLNQHGFLKIPGSSEEPASPAPARPYYEILHGVTCSRLSRPLDLGRYSSLDKDVPFCAESGHLASKNRAKSIDLFTSRSEPGLQFVIIKEYQCCREETRKLPEGHTLESTRELLYLFSPSICHALQSAANGSSNRAMYPKCEESELFPNPEYWVYREMERLDKLIATDPSETGLYLGLFMEYFHLHKEKGFAQLTELLARRKMSARYLGYLYAPGDVIIQRIYGNDNLGHCQAYKVSKWPVIRVEMAGIHDRATAPSDIRTRVGVAKFNFDDSLEFWDFDGVFETKTISNTFAERLGWDSEFDILAMGMVPLRLFPNEMQDQLEARGRTSWACRTIKYVSYRGWDCDKRQEFKRARLMIDPSTFKLLNPAANFAKKKLTDGLGANVMNNKDPPENHDDFLFLVPPDLIGYSMEEKQWFRIWASDVEDVVWNQDSFETLVMGDKEKQLIMALVTHKIEGSKATDFFLGKGNGLVILLHGGPGTGKTLTAESVAEYAQKPLYRVTCGDIGVMPNEVERRLKSVLNLGKTWDCVVLLDEAEVFLQERSLHDLQRNALVSVFLRILEYYDGILILTSNRVGLFDEGFKSRIQLALHYDNLSQATRKKIWKNFIDRLETFDEDINIADLRANLVRLSKWVLNGREIRNVVTTARQLAMFKATSLDFKCLEDVITISVRFATYLKERVNEGLDDDDLAKEKGVRG